MRCVKFAKTIGTTVFCISFGLVELAAAIPVPTPRPVSNSAKLSNGNLSRTAAIPVPEPRPQGPAFENVLGNTQTSTARQTATETRSTLRPTRSASLPSTSASTLNKALTALDKKQPDQAQALRNSLSAPLDREIFDWQFVLSKNSGASSQAIERFMRQKPDWPGQDIMQVRLELALWEEKATPRRVLSALSGRTPETITGRYMEARALLQSGRKSQALEKVRELWHRETLWSALEGRILADFGGLLKRRDHKLRAHYLLYRDRTTAAARLKSKLSAGERALVDARTAVSKRKKSAPSLLAKIPRKQKSDPLYRFSRIQYLRRADKVSEAVALMLKAPRDQAALIHPDEWWIERKLLARELLAAGDYKTAYRIAANHSAQSAASQVDAEFHAGWLSLSFLKNPRQAYPHFEKVLSLATTDRTTARAYYWLGRTQQTAGNRSAARQLYERAGAHGHVFYGQLARETLGKRDLGLKPAPRISQSAYNRFSRRQFATIAQRLDQAGHSKRAGSIIRFMGQNATSREELAMAMTLAETMGEHQYALQAALLADKNGVDPGILAFPIKAIPHSARVPKRVGKPLVYSIARQESAFNIGAVSSANARGLLQLLPSTAKATAKRNGLPYSHKRLTTDATYNATVGAAHLGELLDEFNGSYALVAVGYNAGKRRSYQWSERFGDPRRSSVDIINWIEQIPFSETRKYVKRVLENLQVYKARLDGASLSLTRDLKRGRGS